MSEHIDVAKVENSALRRVRSVDDFCCRYRLGPEEKIRLTRLFGQFATEQELLSNATRAPVFR
ncbi:hypothetical protein ASG25_07290 [Rhizobium sp. Leaf384]|uniref:hypothetical protein n=1 Tax=unclassified Rhizobium TaxID=2613769 RepID=UPI000714C8FA|nr:MULTISPECIES: hypothetical protein [unclassified Rhizobium]KQS81278.1 hypothetical protein ASG25_07290 [Rhizobium sp. Leaf384]KQS87186.1 hypothetical protein ASG58_02850 [Rhizobium sp. Leaf383]